MKNKVTVIQIASANATLCCTINHSVAENSSYKGRYVLYESTFATQESVKEWILDGPGEVTFGSRMNGVISLASSPPIAASVPA